MLPRRKFSDIIHCMDIKQKKTYSKEERRRRNKRFNTVLYIIAGLLVLTGIIIIISDTTLLFDKLFHPGDFIVDVPVPTGEFVFVSPDPNESHIPGVDPDPGLDIPDRTLAPGETPTPSPSTSTGTQSSSVPLSPNRPVYVYFPDYDITCPIDPVGYSWTGNMATVRAHNRAAWLNSSGDPVRGGNTILAGHNKYSGKLGYFDVVKSKLKINDIVVVKTAADELYYYAVVSIDTYPYNSVPYSVMDTEGEPRLTLITCLGDFDHSIGSSKHRVVAVCKPVSFAENGE